MLPGHLHVFLGQVGGFSACYGGNICVFPKFHVDISYGDVDFNIPNLIVL